MKHRIHNYIFYLLVSVIIIFLYYWFKGAGDNVLEILLYPHARTTEIFHNISLVYAEGVGYISAEGAFAIGPECMGMKFIIIMFGMTSCMFAEYFKGLKKLAWLAGSFIGSIIIGILVSCLRIIGSVLFIEHPKFAIFHSVIGISLYFFCLTASYVILSKLIRRDSYEKGV